LTVERGSSRTVISLSDRSENKLHVPSVDVMMQSVASAFGSLAMGIIMTGMGSDGAQGMSAIHRSGGFTGGQDESSCTVYGMPKACAELRILDRVLPPLGNSSRNSAGYALPQGERQLGGCCEISSGLRSSTSRILCNGVANGKRTLWRRIPEESLRYFG
jgi:hypothetical protein